MLSLKQCPWAWARFSILLLVSAVWHKWQDITSKIRFQRPAFCPGYSCPTEKSPCHAASDPADRRYSFAQNRRPAAAHLVSSLAFPCWALRSLSLANTLVASLWERSEAAPRLLTQWDNVCPLVPPRLWALCYSATYNSCIAILCLHLQHKVFWYFQLCGKSHHFKALSKSLPSEHLRLNCPDPVKLVEILNLGLKI